jgi:hypothetical protein
MGNFGSLNREPKDDSFGFYFSEFALSETEGKSSLTLFNLDGIFYLSKGKQNGKEIQSEKWRLDRLRFGLWIFTSLEFGRNK